MSGISVIHGSTTDLGGGGKDANHYSTISMSDQVQFLDGILPRLDDMGEEGGVIRQW
jgi:hypothetical protein